jgi:uncharacterized surface protein with fasciclin (FAS1) repeats
MTEDNKSNNTLYIAIGVIVLIAIIGAVVYSMTMNKPADNKSNDNAMMQKSDDKMMSSDPNATVMVGGAAMFKNKDIISNVVNAPNLSTLVAAVTAADLVTTLQGPGPFTVFGPDNDAFAKLPAGTVESLVKPENKTQLQGILTYHVVSGKLLAADLRDGQTLTTVNGATLMVSKSGNTIKVGGATIKTADVLQSNGVAHVIDTVLLPPAR